MKKIFFFVCTIDIFTKNMSSEVYDWYVDEFVEDRNKFPLG
jgi:hypothetical protein